MAEAAGEVTEFASGPITFGGVFAVATPPTREGSLWGQIAVVRRPGIPFRVDPYCPVNTFYLVPQNFLQQWDALVAKMSPGGEQRPVGEDA